MNPLPRRVAAVARFFGIDSWRALAWVAAGWAVILGLFWLQYSTYGLARYLGWDTSTYVEQAREIQLLGFNASPLRNNYPNLYFGLVWLIGTILGDFGLVERILPIAMGMLLVAIYYRFGRELFQGRDAWIAGVTALLGALSVNTMRLMSDLHRNLFCLIASFLILILLAEIHEGKRSQRSALPWLLLLGALAAFSQMETYAVVLLIALAHTLGELRSRWKVALSVILPVVVAAPFMVNFYTTYPALAFDVDPADPGLVFSDFVYYHGGLLPLLFLAFIGVAALAYQARRGHFVAKLLLAWYATLMALVGFLWASKLGLPPYRPLYLVPTPVLLALAIREVTRVVSRGFSQLSIGALRRRRVAFGSSGLVGTVVAASMALLVVLATSAGLATQKDLYLQPFISDQQYLELEEAGKALLPYAASQPILVFAGYNGSWYYSMAEAYVGIISGPVLGYFGRPQFLLTLTDPLVANPGLSNSPNPARFAATRLYHQLRTSVANISDLSSHPIAVSTPGLYDRPISDYFVVKHRVSPGLYIVFPSEVTPLDLNTWVWFGAYDSSNSSGFTSGPYPWAVSPQVLEYSVQSLAQPWGVSYDMNLTEAVPNATVSMHLLDTPPFPSGWNVQPSDVGGLTIYLDNSVVTHYQYGNQGAKWVNFTLGNLSAGGHILRLEAEQLGKAFGLALDMLTAFPPSVDLGTILAAYRT